MLSIRGPGESWRGSRAVPWVSRERSRDVPGSRAVHTQPGLLSETLVLGVRAPPGWAGAALLSGAALQRRCGSLLARVEFAYWDRDSQNVACLTSAASYSRGFSRNVAKREECVWHRWV